MSAFQKHYIIGPTAEVHLPLHLSIEVDALYRRNGFSVVGNDVTNAYNIKAGVSDWQIPFLLKYEAKVLPVRPFVDTGIVYRHVGGLSASQLVTPDVCLLSSGCPIPVSATSRSNTAGYALGGGVTFKLAHLRIPPEIRFTHWLSSAFVIPYIGTGSNQADLLVGVTF